MSELELRKVDEIVHRVHMDRCGPWLESKKTWKCKYPCAIDATGRITRADGLVRFEIARLIDDRYQYGYQRRQSVEYTSP